MLDTLEAWSAAPGASKGLAAALGICPATCCTAERKVLLSHTWTIGDSHIQLLRMLQFGFGMGKHVPMHGASWSLLEASVAEGRILM